MADISATEKMYTLRELVETFILKTRPEDSLEICAVEEFIDAKRKYFQYFLGEISIPDVCFKNTDGEWSFNEDGKILFLEILEEIRQKRSKNPIKPKLYQSMRKGQFYIAYAQEYLLIIDRICSNLEANRIKAQQTSAPGQCFVYPDKNDVCQVFWSSVMNGLDRKRTSVEDSTPIFLREKDLILVLPGIDRILKILETAYEDGYLDPLLMDLTGDNDSDEPLLDNKEIVNIIKSSESSDLIHLSSYIQAELDVLDDDVKRRYIVLALKWLSRIMAVQDFRKEEDAHILHQYPSYESILNQIFSDAPREPTYTLGLSKKCAKTRDTERKHFEEEMVKAASNWSDVLRESGLNKMPYRTRIEDIYKKVIENEGSNSGNS